MKLLPRLRKQGLSSALAAPKEEHPFVFFQTLESLNSSWEQITAYLSRSAFHREVPIDLPVPYDLIRQARVVWPVLQDNKKLYVLMRGDILTESFLTDPQVVDTIGRIKPIGYILTAHRFLDRAVFKPTVCETLARIRLVPNTLRHAAKGQKLVAFDFAAPSSFLREKMQGICQSKSGPFLAFHDIGGLPIHLSVAQLYAGSLSKRLAEYPVFCGDRKYEAYRREVQVPPLHGRLFPDPQAAPNGLG